jgi:hypothetical protein
MPVLTSSATAPEGDDAPDPTFSHASRAVHSQPSLDSEAMVDAALMNMMHDELPTLPPLSDLTTGPTHAHATLDIFDAL